MNLIFERNHLEDDFEDGIIDRISYSLLFRIRRRNLIIIPFWSFNHASYKYFTGKSYIQLI